MKGFALHPFCDGREPAFGGLVKLHSAPVGRYRMEIFFLAYSLNEGLTPKPRANRKAHGRAVGFSVGTV